MYMVVMFLSAQTCSAVYGFSMFYTSIETHVTIPDRRGLVIKVVRSVTHVRSSTHHPSGESDSLMSDSISATLPKLMKDFLLRYAVSQESHCSTSWFWNELQKDLWKWMKKKKEKNGTAAVRVICIHHKLVILGQSPEIMAPWSYEL